MMLTVDKEKLFPRKSYCCKEKIIVANEKLLLPRKSYCCREKVIIVAYQWQLWATVLVPLPAALAANMAAVGFGEAQNPELPAWAVEGSPASPPTAYNSNFNR